MIGRYGLFAALAAVLLLGVADARPPQKIVGGTLAALGEFPYIVSLRLRGQHMCGGTIIGKRHIVTAAHCVAGIVTYPYTDFVVATGTISSRTGKTHVVKSVLYHAQYDTAADTSPNDIAIIALVSDITFDAYTRQVNLPTAATPSGGAATAIGWGYLTASSPIIVEGLRKVSVQTLDPQSCQLYLLGSSILYTHQICTVAPTGYGICQGDSGGPLVQGGVLIGIVSYDVPCGIGYPDVYSSVFHYLDWIQQVVASA